MHSAGSLLVALSLTACGFNIDDGQTSDDALGYEPAIARWGEIITSPMGTCARPVHGTFRLDVLSPCTAFGPATDDPGTSYNVVLPVDATIDWLLDSALEIDPSKPVVYAYRQAFPAREEPQLFAGDVVRGFTVITPFDVFFPPLAEGEEPMSLTCGDGELFNGYVIDNSIAKDGDLEIVGLDVDEAKAELQRQHPNMSDEPAGPGVECPNGSRAAFFDGHSADDDERLLPP